MRFGFIIGIIYELYFETSIAFILLILGIIYFICQKTKFKVPIWLNNKVVLLIFISALISNSYILYLNKQYNEFYNNVPEAIKTTAIVVGEAEKKENYYRYIIEINEGEYKSKKFYLNISSNILEYGNLISIEGEYKIPNQARNYKGFDYREYLKTKKIYGTIKVDKTNIKVIEKEKANILLILSSKARNFISNRIKEILPEETSSLLIGILLGDKSEIDKNIIENFKTSNLSHMLAVSGLHTGYIILGVTYILGKSKISKRWIYILTIFTLFAYMFITNFTISIVRACLMSSLILLSSLFYRKPDIASNISLSLLIILINNPFTITDIGFELSYLGTIGIIVFINSIQKILNKTKINKKITKLMAVSISAQIMIMPVMALRFNTISLTFLISNLLASPILGINIILGIVVIIVSIISNIVSKFISIPLNLNLKLLIYIAGVVAKIPLSSIIIKTPYLITIILWYIIILILNYLYLKNKLFNPKVLIFIKKGLALIIIVIILFNIFSFLKSFIFPNLNVHFVDVGQGDSTLIITPNNKKILIDGGEENQDVLLQYLLDRRITTIDYIIISHFDSDHSNGIISIVENLKVKNIIIGKQFETSENYEKFVKKSKEKNIKVYVVEAGNRINIEKDLYFDILWPDSKNIISDNGINNNSLVFKLVYKDFSMLFTGDIEEKAEKAILQKYKDNLNILNATVLKVAHHGSKTSSSKDFLEVVKPKIALIGVAANNIFGHPSNITLENLEKIKCKIFRTDRDGEIILKVNKEKKICIYKMLKD